MKLSDSFIKEKRKYLYGSYSYFFKGIRKIVPFEEYLKQREKIIKVFKNKKDENKRN